MYYKHADPLEQHKYSKLGRVWTRDIAWKNSFVKSIEMGYSEASLIREELKGDESLSHNSVQGQMRDINGSRPFEILPEISDCDFGKSVKYDHLRHASSIWRIKNRATWRLHRVTSVTLVSSAIRTPIHSHVTRNVLDSVKFYILCRASCTGFHP